MNAAKASSTLSGIRGTIRPSFLAGFSLFDKGILRSLLIKLTKLAVSGILLAEVIRSLD